MEVERELCGPHSFQFVAKTHTLAETHFTYVLYHLSFHVRTWNIIPATSLAKSEYPSKRVTHAQRAGH